MEERILTHLNAFLNQIPELHIYFVTYGYVSYPCQCVFKRVTGFKIRLHSSLPSPNKTLLGPPQTTFFFEVDYNTG